MFYKEYIARFSRWGYEQYKRISELFGPTELKIDYTEYSRPEVPQRLKKVSFKKRLTSKLTVWKTKIFGGSIPYPNQGVLEAEFEIPTATQTVPTTVQFGDFVYWTYWRYHTWRRVNKDREVSIFAAAYSKLKMKARITYGYPLSALIVVALTAAFYFTLTFFKTSLPTWMVNIFNSLGTGDMTVLAIAAVVFWVIIGETLTARRVIMSDFSALDVYTSVFVKRKHGGEPLFLTLPHEEPPANEKQLNKYIKKVNKLGQRPETIDQLQVLGTTILHTALVGPTGAGKTTAVLEPTIIDRAMRRLPVWLFDPKMDMKPLYTLFDHLYVIDLSGNKGVSIDPFAVLRYSQEVLNRNADNVDNEVKQAVSPEKFINKIADMFIAMLGNEGNQQFWTESAKTQLFIPLLTALYDKGFPFGYVGILYDLLSENEAIARRVLSYAGGDVESNPYYIGATTPPDKAAQNVTLFSFTSTAKPLIQLLRSPQFISLFGNTTLRFEEFYRPSTLIIVTWSQITQSGGGKGKVSAEQLMMNTVYLIFRTVAYIRPFLVAEEAARLGVRKDDLLYTITLLMDELAQFGKIESMEQDARLLRSYKLQLVAGIQDMPGFEHIYGKEVAKSIWSNFRRKIFLPGNLDPVTLNEYLNTLETDIKALRISHDTRGKLSESTEEKKIKLGQIYLNELGGDVVKNEFQALIIESVQADKNINAVTLTRMVSPRNVKKELAGLAEESVSIPYRKPVETKTIQQIKQELLAAFLSG